MNSHIKLQNYFVELSLLFGEYYGDPDAKTLPFQKDVHSWLNYFCKSPIFRHIHLEYYKTDKICVLHSNLFPNPLVDLPIMGFDLIALGDKISGLFFDFTPTVTEYHALRHSLENLHARYKSKKRQLPEWATFFSDSFYCVTPEPNEMDKIFKDIKLYIKHYLEFGKGKLQEYAFNIAIQNGYCKGQQKNDKTYKALAAEIGSKDAKKFLTKYLFPKIAIK
jgi:hypothetical protein